MDLLILWKKISEFPSLQVMLLMKTLRTKDKHSFSSVEACLLSTGSEQQRCGKVPDFLGILNAENETRSDRAET